MRIVVIITKLDLGGAQETALGLAEGSAAAGHEVLLIAGPEVGENMSLLEDAKRRGIAVVVEHRLVRRISPWRDLRVVITLTRMLRHQRADVVHTHSSKAGIVGRIAARLAGVPTVVHTVHGWSFRDTQPKPVRLLYVELERLVARVSTRIIVVATSDRDVGLARAIGRRSQYAVIRSGIDVGRWMAPSGDRVGMRSEFGIPGDHFAVLSVARLAPPKDPETLLRAVAQVERLTCVVIGQGPQRRGLEALANELGIRGRVRFPGARLDIPDLTPAFDAFVLSSWTEGLPRTVVEAMAAGLPVVASDVGGVGEVVEDGASGLLVPPGDVTAMAAALSRLVADRELRRRLSERGREVAQRFSQEQMVRATLELYAEGRRVHGPDSRADRLGPHRRQGGAV